jgi:hypothetical protein
MARGKNADEQMASRRRENGKVVIEVSEPTYLEREQRRRGGSPDFKQERVARGMERSGFSDPNDPDADEETVGRGDLLQHDLDKPFKQKRAKLGAAVMDESGWGKPPPTNTPRAVRRPFKLFKEPPKSWSARGVAGLASKHAAGSRAATPR